MVCRPLVLNVQEISGVPTKIKAAVLYILEKILQAELD